MVQYLKNELFQEFKWTCLLKIFQVEKKKWKHEDLRGSTYMYMLLHIHRIGCMLTCIILFHNQHVLKEKIHILTIQIFNRYYNSCKGVFWGKKGSKLVDYDGFFLNHQIYIIGSNMSTNYNIIHLSTFLFDP